MLNINVGYKRKGENPYGVSTTTTGISVAKRVRYHPVLIIFLSIRVVLVFFAGDYMFVLDNYLYH